MDELEEYVKEKYFFQRFTKYLHRLKWIPA